ncbi:hypothetical protein WMF01_52945 [Sorangium sp. So ce1667]
MVALEQARRIVQTYAEQHGAVWFDDTVVDRGGYWFFRVGYIGSCGVIVDKADGRLSIMGSALSPDDCFWGHEHGFSPDLALLRVTKVHDHRRTIEILLHVVTNGPPRRGSPNPKRAWLAEQLQSLPCDFGPGRLWLSIPIFRDATQQRWFEYEVLKPHEQAGQVGR